MDISVIDLKAQYEQALQLWPFLPGYESFARLPRMMLFAVGSRETNLDPAYTRGSVGDSGHGHGVWQLDDRSHHIPAGFDTDVHIQAQTAAEMLVDNFDEVHAWVPALAMYNSGQTNDQFTTGHDYAADVIERMGALNTMFPPPTPPHPDRLLVPQTPPMVGLDVMFYQTAMNNKHLANPPLAQDGIYGPLTVAAVKHFQAQYGLTVDGIIGPNTSTRMAAVPLPR